MLAYLPQHSIDKNQWNHLVDRSNGSKGYSYSIYLDALCTWDAIVLDNYAGGIALPVTQRYGIRQLYQPPFIQQCVWLGDPLSDIQRAELWKLLCKKFHRIHFNTNLKFASSSPRINLVLELDRAETIRKNFSKSLRKNLKRSNESVLCSVVSSCKQSLALYRKAYGALNPQLSAQHYSALEQLQTQHPDKFVCIEVSHNGEVIAGLLFLRDARRLYYILGAPTVSGRDLNAISHGISYIIGNFCQQNLMLDFEGSSIPNVKAFFESFGSHNEGFFETQYTPNILLRSFLKFYSKLFKS